MGKIVVVDYGMGNLRSVAQALASVAPDQNICVSNKVSDIVQADRIVLPGQGAMPDCMKGLQDHSLVEAIQLAARTKPLLGVCIGEQMLFDWSEEGEATGLGLLKGYVKKFDGVDKAQTGEGRCKIPHMGWNSVEQMAENRPQHLLWQGIPNGSYFYFVHSYYVKPDRLEDVVGMTHYGKPFVSAVACDNIFATQFHPEKSAEWGLLLYKNFTLWCP